MVKKGLSDEDLQVWAHYTQGIKPLHPGHHQGVRSHRNAITADISVPESRKKITQLVKPPSARDLKNVHIHARLDLHGLSQDVAYDRIIKFIERAYHGKCRCVLIITGKGLAETEHWWQEQGILRQQVPRWLMEEPMHSKITTYTHARPEHGGTGALYVFIRKK